MNLFFELIQVSIGTLPKLSSAPSATQWNELYTIAKRQAIIGICFQGVQLLYKNNPIQVKYLPSKLKMQWLAVAANIQKHNEKLNLRAQEITRLFANGGFQSCVLKGQGVAILYNNVIKCESILNKGHMSLRQSGDIDLWVKGQRKAVIAFMKQMNWNVGVTVIHHTDAKIFDDVETEIHHYPSYTFSPFRWKKYKKWFNEQANIQFQNYDSSTQFYHPTTEFNLVYLLMHIYRHVFHEGIGLRQLMDYYMLLCTASADNNCSQLSNRVKSQIMETLKYLGLEQFAAAVMYVEQQVFGLKNEFLLCSPNKETGIFLLNEIMHAGNFGQFDQRTKKAHNGSDLRLFSYNTLRLYKMVRFNPSEVIWAPFWKIGHWFYRKIVWNHL